MTLGSRPFPFASIEFTKIEHSLSSAAFFTSFSNCSPYYFSLINGNDRPSQSKTTGNKIGTKLQKSSHKKTAEKSIESQNGRKEIQRKRKKNRSERAKEAMWYELPRIVAVDELENSVRIELRQLVKFKYLYTHICLIWNVESL